MAPFKGDETKSPGLSRPLPRGPLAFVALIILLLPALIAQGQPRGGLLGLVTNDEGLELESVEIMLEAGDKAFKTQSDEHGRFSFDRLSPGAYRLTVRGVGYSEARHSPLTVRAGRPTSVRVQLAEAVDEVLVVATEPSAAVPEPSPTVVIGGDVERIAADRDPFATLDRVPGVHVEGDAGDENVLSHGAGDSLFFIDGVESDAAPAAVSPSSRLQITDAGANVISSGPGMIVNLTTPSSGPKRRADIEATHADSSWIGPATFDDVNLGTGGLNQAATQPGRVEEITTWGVDAGGSLFDDRLWLWGAFNHRELRGTALGGAAQEGDLEHGALKLSATLTPSNSLNLGGHRTERQYRGVGASTDRGDGATQNDYSPSTWLKLENAHQFGDDLLLTVHLGRTADALALEPLGNDEIYLDEGGVWQGGWLERQEQIDATTAHADLTWALRSGRGEHELRTGFSRRSSETSQLESWGDQNVLILAGENYGTPFDLVRLHRPIDLELERDLDATWVQDRVTFSGTTDWTFDIGLRFERQSGLALGGESASHPLFPELLPGTSSAAAESVEFQDLLPRFGAAWTPGGPWSPTVRFGWSRFAGRLRDDLLERVSPLAGAEVLLGFDDVDNDRRFSANEPFRVLNRHGFDAADPTVAGEAPAPGLRSELTDEWRFGFEARPVPTLEVRVDAVHREVSRIFDVRRLVRDTAGGVRLAQVADYRFDALYSGFLPDGSPYAVPVYSLVDGLELTGASLIQNGDRRQTYDAVTFGVTRRLSRGFMLRAHATWSDWSWDIPATFGAFDDPTNTALGDLDGVDDDGAVVTGRGAEDRWVNSRWSFDLLALVQIAPNARWGFDLSAHVHGREGYPIPYSLSVISDDRLREVQVTSEVDSYRLDDVITLDLRLEKPISLGASDLTLALDILNVLNEGNVLEREARISSPAAGDARATLSPRIVQFGIRWSWR